MPASSFIAYYSLATGRLRGWILFNAGPNSENENDSHVAAQLALKPPVGVAVLSFPVAQYGTQDQIQALVTAHTGIPFPPNDAHDCFDAQGNYVCTVNCDPQGCGDGAPPEASQMIASVGATPGSTYINGTFTPAPTPVIIPKGTTGNTGTITPG